MQSFLVSIPTSVLVTVNAETEEVALSEDVLVWAVLDQHGKYAAVDHRHIGYENARILDS